MINSEVFIIKRDGKKETFSLDKIKNAIAKAFLSVVWGVLLFYLLWQKKCAHF